MISQTKNFQIAEIITPLPIFDYLDYKIPNDGYDYKVGDYVKISIGSRYEIGIITKIKSDSNFEKLKFITAHYAILSLNPCMIDFMHKVSHYTLAPIGDILKSVLQGFVIDNQSLQTEYLVIDKVEQEKLTPKRQEIIDYLHTHSYISVASECRRVFFV
jgi:primosomal protein N'